MSNPTPLPRLDPHLKPNSTNGISPKISQMHQVYSQHVTQPKISKQQQDELNKQLKQSGNKLAGNGDVPDKSDEKNYPKRLLIEAFNGKTNVNHTTNAVNSKFENLNKKSEEADYHQQWKNKKHLNKNLRELNLDNMNADLDGKERGMSKNVKTEPDSVINIDNGVARTGSTVKECLGEFEDAEIVPDVTSIAPSEYISLKYATQTVDLGTVLTPEEAGEQPQIDFAGTNGTLYTLALVDPDAPSRANHTFRNYRHWLVVNIPGPSNVERGEIVSEYIGPAPPAGGGYHRYTFLAYEQEDIINVELDENRRSFDIEQFAQDFKLSGPLYGNYFQSENV